MTAGYAVLLADVCSVSGSGQVGRIEKLRCSQRVAYLDIAVTDCKNFILAVNVCDLMNKAVILGTLEDLVGLFLGDKTVFTIL